jgi:hypothetical protein
MKRILSLVFGLVLLISLVFTFNAQTVSADTTYKVAVTKTGVLDTTVTPWKIHYTYSITNTGSVTLYNVKLYDDKLGWIINASEGKIIYPSSSTNSPKSIPGTADYYIQPGDPLQIVNTATAYAQKKTGGSGYSDVTLGGTPSFTCTVNLPGISLVKTGYWQTTSNTINYQFVVTNTGNVALDNIALEDTKLGSITWQPGFTGTLNPGQVCTATGTYTVPGSSINSVDNTATVTARLQGSSTNYVTATGSCTVSNMGNTYPLPDLGAGLLFGTGIAGLGAIVLIRKQTRSSRQV